MLRMLLIIVASVTLSGCGANFTSIYRDYKVDPDKETTTVLIDAKQRAIISTPNKKSTSGRTAFVCAEPSPDALSAISASLAGGVGLARPDKEERIALSTAVQEAAKQLGTRNATIQLLRDGLYRQCEAYMNGLISDETYDQIANKYINAMVVLLAVEQITTPTPTTIQSGERVDPDGAVKTEVNLSVMGIQREKKTDQESSETPKSPAGTDAPKDDIEKAATEESAADTTHAESPGQPSGNQVAPDASAQPDQADGASKPPTNAEQRNGADSTANSTNDPSGESSASATAGSPVVNVQLPQLVGSGVSDSVATAVREMTHTFLRKDTVDFCLYTLPRLAEGPSSAGANDASKTLVEGFVDVCRLIVATEYTGGAVLPNEIFDFLQQEAERRAKLRSAESNIPNGSPPAEDPAPPPAEDPAPPPAEDPAPPPAEDPAPPPAEEPAPPPAEEPAPPPTEEPVQG